MDRVWLIVTGVYGFLAVGLGAFGAHGLESLLAGAEDATERLAWWETASKYHLAHALALGLVSWLATRAPGKATFTAGVAFATGVLLFSGSLYAMSLTDVRGLAAVTPFGGLLLLVGWAAVVISAARGARGVGFADG